MKYFFIILLSIIFLFISFLVYTETGFLLKGYKTIKIYTGFFSGPALKLVDNIFSSFKDLLDKYVYLVHLREENIELKKRIEKMELELQRISLLEKENKRLAELLEFKEKTPLTLLTARIISEDPKSWYKGIIVDKGRRHGIKEKMPVISTKGLVGLCVEVNLWHTKVMVINDVHSCVDAIIEEKNIRGILEGTGFQYLRLKYVSKKENVGVGDILVTSGKDGLYPRGLPIGRIMEVKRENPDIFAHIEVMPYSDYRTLEEVFIIR